MAYGFHDDRSKAPVYTQSETQDYVAQQIAMSQHLKKQVVETLPDPAQADLDTLYYILNQETGFYDIYQLIDGEMVRLDDTTIDLTQYYVKDEVDAMIDELDENCPFEKTKLGNPLVLDLDDIKANNERYEWAADMYYFSDAQKTAIATWIHDFPFIDPQTHQIIQNPEYGPSPLACDIDGTSYDATGELVNYGNFRVVVSTSPLQPSYNLLLDITSGSGFLVTTGMVYIPSSVTGILTVYSDSDANSYYTSEGDLRIWDNIIDKPITVGDLPTQEA